MCPLLQSESPWQCLPAESGASWNGEQRWVVCSAASEGCTLFFRSNQEPLLPQRWQKKAPPSARMYSFQWLLALLPCGLLQSGQILTTYLSPDFWGSQGCGVLL